MFRDKNFYSVISDYMSLSHSKTFYNSTYPLLLKLLSNIKDINDDTKGMKVLYFMGEINITFFPIQPYGYSHSVGLLPPCTDYLRSSLHNILCISLKAHNLLNIFIEIN